jgi:surfeit locus 1 family protein
MKPRVMKPRTRQLIVPTAMTLIMLPLLIMLGQWQLERMDWKTNLLTQLEANPKLPVLMISNSSRLTPADEFRKVSISCAADSKSAVFSEGMRTDGKTQGSYISCRLPGGPIVMIDAETEQLPAPDNKNAYTVSGTLRQWQAPSWQRKMAGNLPASIALFARKNVSPFYVNGQGVLPRAEDIANNHFAYAVQWFAFAGVLLVIYGIYARRIWRESPAA